VAETTRATEARRHGGALGHVLDPTYRPAPWVWFASSCQRGRREGIRPGSGESESLASAPGTWLAPYVRRCISRFRLELSLRLRWSRAAPRPPPVPEREPCQPYPAEASDALIRVEGGSLGLLDGRPFIVPQGAWDRLTCDSATLRLPPGPHSATLSRQVAGYSVMVEESYAWFSCRFVAEPGHRYHLRLKSPTFSRMATYRCEVEDATLGRMVAAQEGCVNLPRFSLPCSQHEHRSAALAEIETIRAYAACGNQLAQGALREIRAQGCVNRSGCPGGEPMRPEDWELPECEPLFDLH
jgi:hypothetical protein